MKDFILDLAPVKPAQLYPLTCGGYKIRLSAAAEQAIGGAAQYLANKIASSPQTPIYGVNTGFGALCATAIPADQLEALQYNIIQSHACASGDEVPQEIVRLMLVLKARSLAYGHSGVKPETVERLLDFYNQNILPVVYTQGSLGASGDLAPLAHLSLPLIGLGKVRLDGAIIPAESLAFTPLKLGPKEGLALLNGTQFMSAYGVWLLARAERLLRWADVAAALSISAFGCAKQPFHFLLQKIRPHEGQKRTAATLLRLLKGDETPVRGQVQDPYSFRCVPQVHGAIKDTYRFAEDIFTTEVNSVSDNPNIFPEEDLILSGGNFHGQSPALALDFLAIGLAQLGAISERRVYHLISGARGLPAFLSPDPGLHSGFMIAQYLAAGLVNEIKHAAAPHSLDSISSCNGQEDYVSMGANAAVKAMRVTTLLTRLLSIELMHAVEALRYSAPAQTGVILRELVLAFQDAVPPLTRDRILTDDIAAACAFIDDYPIETLYPES